MLKGFHCQADILTERSFGYYPSRVTILLRTQCLFVSPFPISCLHWGWPETAAQLLLVHGEFKPTAGPWNQNFKMGLAITNQITKVVNLK